MKTKGMKLVTGEQVTEEKYLERAAAVAMSSPEHMKEWLEKSGRRWMVFNGMELIDALPWPEGVQEVMDVISLYRNHRRTIPSGRTETIIEPVTRKEVTLPLCKDEHLELEELDRCVRYLIAQIYELDPKWSLENPSL